MIDVVGKKIQQSTTCYSFRPLEAVVTITFEQGSRELKTQKMPSANVFGHFSHILKTLAWNGSMSKIFNHVQFCISGLSKLTLS